VATEVIMPKVDMVMETGTFVEWLKKEGDHVNKGDPLFIITTDKANIELESPAEGVLAGVKAKPDDVIPVTEIIAYILAAGEALPAKAAPQPVVATPVAAAPIAAGAVPMAATEAVGLCKVRATPLARRMAQDLGVDLKQLSGRGPLGRIHKADVLAFQKPQPAVERATVPAPAQVPAASAPRAVPTPAGPAPQIPLPDARRKSVVPLAGPRKIIAERMAYSAFTAPHITLSLHVDMTEAIRFRERVLEPLKSSDRAARILHCHPGARRRYRAAAPPLPERIALGR
jgi:pyruvate dehydrogenase E2 component (dihydrolipoamide acetyltransferase)